MKEDWKPKRQALQLLLERPPPPWQQGLPRKLRTPPETGLEWGTKHEEWQA